jgi:hypothetical protein
VSQKYRVRKNRLWGATILIILILLTADIFAVYTFGLFDTKHPSMDTGKWYYRLQKEDHLSEGTEDWLEVHKIGNSIKSKENSILYYKTQLPDSSIPDPCILLQTNDQVFRIFLDGKVIYSFGNFDAFDFKHSPGAPLHFITLPQNYQNRELVIEMKAIDKERLGLIRAIEVDSRSNHIMRLLRSGMGPLVLGFLDIIIGTACLLIGIVRRLGRQALISLGNSFVVMGIWSISENNLTQLFYLKPILWYYLAVASLRCKHPVILHNSAVVSKSYPNFFEDFKRLGGMLHERNLG